MRRPMPVPRLLSQLCVVVFLGALLLPAPSTAVPVGYVLTLEDEFEGTTLDPAIWDHRLPGPRRDGVNTPDAAGLDGNGHLVIDTWTEGGVHHTGMIGTQGRFEQRYGWFEARINFDDSPGMWSAFWLQTPDMGQFIGDPARAGVEMDIVEHDLFTSWNLGDVWNGGLHWDGYGADHEFHVNPQIIPGMGDGFHTYALEWTATTLHFYYDDQLVWDASASPISQRSEFLILSSEVEDGSTNIIPAGGFGSRAQSSTRMVVDYVRVYSLVPEPGSAGLLIAGLAWLGRVRPVKRLPRGAALRLDRRPSQQP